jgi:pSer/pThr/pTyr-binding forkhead associated (FHA) protein
MIEMREIDHALVVTGQTYPLLPLTSLGRAPTNSIPIPDDFASGEHCLLALRSGQWWLEDRQSKNGTTINGVPVTQPLIITDGDVIGIGSTRFRLELEQ